MKRFIEYAATVIIGVANAGLVFAGEASTGAWARNQGGAGASANYVGQGGPAYTRTDTRSGNINLARGLAVGFDQDGLDFSFSHAIASRFGPAFAGTFNLSIGFNGSVSGSYGGVVSNGGVNRSAEAGGNTRSGPAGSQSQAMARGDANPWGTVNARTDSYSQDVRKTPVFRRSNGSNTPRR